MAFVRLRLIFPAISSAVLTQVKGGQRWFQPSMHTSTAVMRFFTEVNVSRRMAWRVMMPKQISTMCRADSCSHNARSGRGTS